MHVFYGFLYSPMYSNNFKKENKIKITLLKMVTNGWRTVGQLLKLKTSLHYYLANVDDK